MRQAQYFELFEGVDWEDGGEPLIMVSRRDNPLADRNLYGIVSPLGEIVCPVIYDRLEYSWPGGIGIAVTIKDGKRGLIDRAGKVLIEPVYDDIEVNHSDDNEWCDLNLSMVELNGRYGLVDEKGRELYPPVLYEIEDCIHNRFIVRDYDSFGLINSSGKTVLPIKFKYMGYLSHRPVLKVQYNGKYGVSDTAGNMIIPCKYEELEYHRNKFIVFAEGKTSVLDSMGNLLIPPMQLPFRYRIVDVYGSDYMQYSKWGILDPPGRFLFRALNDVAGERNQSEPGIKDKAWVSFRDYLQKDTTNAELLMYLGEDFSDMPNGRFHLFNMNGRFGVVDSSWHIVVEPQFEEIRIGKGFFEVRSGNVWGLLDTSGNITVPCQFLYISHLGNDLFGVSTNKLSGIIRKDGSVLAQVKYDEIEPDKRGVFWVKSGDLWGMVDSTGREITPIKYGEQGDYLKSVGMFKVESDGRRDSYGYQGYVNLVDLNGREFFFHSTYKYLDVQGKFIKVRREQNRDGEYPEGLTDLRGNVIVPAENMRISIEENSILVQKTYYTAYLISADNTSVRTEFDSIEPFEENGFAMARRGKQTFMIDRYGSFVEVLAQ